MRFKFKKKKKNFYPVFEIKGFFFNPVFGFRKQKNISSNVISIIFLMHHQQTSKFEYHRLFNHYSEYKIRSRISISNLIYIYRDYFVDHTYSKSKIFSNIWVGKSSNANML